MDKPITVARVEFIDKLVELVNNSGLPSFVIMPVLDDALREMKRITDEQYRNDFIEWNESQKAAGAEANDGRIPDDQGT